MSESDSNTMLYLDSNGNFSAGRIRQILMTKYAGKQVCVTSFLTKLIFF